MDDRYKARAIRKKLPDACSCFDCRKRITKNGIGSRKIRLHHIIPPNDGGLSIEDNLIPLCGFCHKQRHLRNDT